MTGRGHQIVGLVLAAPCFYFSQRMGFPMIPGLLCSMGVIWGANAPDYMEITYGKGRGRKSVFKHRGITHWWLPWMALFVVLYSALLSVHIKTNIVDTYLLKHNINLLPFQGMSYFYLALIGFVIGGLSHLLTDVPNMNGIPAFTPFDLFCLKLWKSGEFEKTIIGLFIIGSVFYINYFHIQQPFKHFIASFH